MKVLSTVIILLNLFGCINKPNNKTTLIGKPMPSLELLSLDSQIVNTNNWKTGSKTVIFYLTPVCPYCNAMTKDIIDKIKTLPNTQFNFVSNFPIKELRAFSNKHNLSQYSNIQLLEDNSGMVMNYFNIREVPFVAIFDSVRILSSAEVGKVDASRFKSI